MDGVEDGLQDAREAALHYVLTPEKEDLVTFEEAVAQTWARLDRISNMTTFTPARLALIQQCGEYAALRLANLRLREKLHDQSIRDPLTGLYNRRFLEATLEQELHRSGRHHIGLGVIMADIDKFKAFNDSFGHTAGDIVLKEVGALFAAPSGQKTLSAGTEAKNF
jgi:GAF domain-containing protein